MERKARNKQLVPGCKQTTNQWMVQWLLFTNDFYSHGNESSLKTRVQIKKKSHISRLQFCLNYCTKVKLCFHSSECIGLARGICPNLFTSSAPPCTHSINSKMKRGMGQNKKYGREECGGLEHLGCSSSPLFLILWLQYESPFRLA